MFVLQRNVIACLKRFGVDGKDPERRRFERGLARAGLRGCVGHSGNSVKGIDDGLLVQPVATDRHSCGIHLRRDVERKGRRSQ
jgi:hypothetical protein